MSTRFLVRWRAGLLSALFLISSLALSFSPWLSSPANAASWADNVIEVVPEMVLHQTFGGYDDIDISVNWPGVFEATSGNVTTGGSTYDYSWGSESSNYSAFKDIWDNKEYWGVSSLSYSDGGTVSALIWATEDPNATGTFYGGPPCTVGVNYCALTVNDHGYDTFWIVVSLVDSDSVVVETSGSGTTNDIAHMYIGGSQRMIYFAYLESIDYPTDYEGPIPPETGGPTPVFIPKIGYHVTDGNEVNGLWLTEPECAPVGITDTTGCGAYKLRWTIIGPDDVTVLDQKTLDRYAPYKFQLPGNDNYTLTVETVGFGPPALPLASDVEFLKLIFDINANGTFVVGGTELNTCEQSGIDYNCGEADPMEDCSTYAGEFPFGFGGAGEAADLVGGFGCIIGNFGIWLRNTLINLFIPGYSFFGTFQTELGDFLNSKLGFVATAFSFIVGIFGGIVTGAVTTSCTVAPPGTIFGATFSVDICFIEDNFPTAFGIMQGLIIALTVIALFFAGLRKYHEVVDQR